jgi:ribosome-binding factor A
MKLRRERLGDEIRDLLGGWFSGGQLNDPRVQGMTITAVRLSGDLQLATVFFRTFCDLPLDEVQAGLRSVGGLLRHRLSGILEIRRVPALRFKYDESIERGERIEKIISVIH